MVIYLIGLGGIVLTAAVLFLKRTGSDRVLIREKERPHRLIGCKVQAFIPSLRSQPGWLSPPGKVLEYQDESYVVEFRNPWTTEYGSLSSIRVRSAMDGNPVSKLASPAASSIPIIVKFLDGREARWELATGFETPDA